MILCKQKPNLSESEIFHLAGQDNVFLNVFGEWCFVRFERFWHASAFLLESKESCRQNDAMLIFIGPTSCATRLVKTCYSFFSFSLHSIFYGLTDILHNLIMLSLIAKFEIIKWQNQVKRKKIPEATTIRLSKSVTTLISFTKTEKCIIPIEK